MRWAATTSPRRASRTAAPSTAWTSRPTSARSTTASAAARTIKRYDVCTQHSAAAVRQRGHPAISCAFGPTDEVAVTCDTYGGLLDASGTRTMNFANPSDPLKHQRALRRPRRRRHVLLDGHPGGPARAVRHRERPADGSLDRRTGPWRRRRLQPVTAARSAHEHLARHDHDAEHVEHHPRSARRPSPVAMAFVGTVARHARPRGRPRPAAHVRAARCCSTRACRSAAPRRVRSAARTSRSRSRGPGRARAPPRSTRVGTLSTKIAPGARPGSWCA